MPTETITMGTNLTGETYDPDRARLLQLVSKEKLDKGLYDEVYRELKHLAPCYYEFMLDRKHSMLRLNYAKSALCLGKLNKALSLLKAEKHLLKPYYLHNELLPYYQQILTYIHYTHIYLGSYEKAKHFFKKHYNVLKDCRGVSTFQFYLNTPWFIKRLPLFQDYLVPNSYAILIINQLYKGHDFKRSIEKYIKPIKIHSLFCYHDHLFKLTAALNHLGFHDESCYVLSFLDEEDVSSENWTKLIHGNKNNGAEKVILSTMAWFQANKNSHVVKFLKNYLTVKNINILFNAFFYTMIIIRVPMTIGFTWSNPIGLIFPLTMIFLQLLIHIMGCLRGYITDESKGKLYDILHYSLTILTQPIDYLIKNSIYYLSRIIIQSIIKSFNIIDQGMQLMIDLVVNIGMQLVRLGLSVASYFSKHAIVEIFQQTLLNRFNFFSSLDSSHYVDYGHNIHSSHSISQAHVTTCNIGEHRYLDTAPPVTQQPVIGTKVNLFSSAPKDALTSLNMGHVQGVAAQLSMVCASDISSKTFGFIMQYYTKIQLIKTKRMQYQNKCLIQEKTRLIQLGQEIHNINEKIKDDENDICIYFFRDCLRSRTNLMDDSSDSEIQNYVDALAQLYEKTREAMPGYESRFMQRIEQELNNPDYLSIRKPFMKKFNHWKTIYEESTCEPFQLLADLHTKKRESHLHHLNPTFS